MNFLTSLVFKSLAVLAGGGQLMSVDPVHFLGQVTLLAVLGALNNNSWDAYLKELRDRGIISFKRSQTLMWGKLLVLSFVGTLVLQDVQWATDVYMISGVAGAGAYLSSRLGNALLLPDLLKQSISGMKTFFRKRLPMARLRCQPAISY